MSTQNIQFHGEIRKILHGCPLLSGAMPIYTIYKTFMPVLSKIQLLSKQAQGSILALANLLNVS